MTDKLNKKAEISTSTLVVIILLILGFAILLWFFWQIGFSGRVDKEVCHQSVIFRATLPAFGGAKELVPLKCKTEKICITSSLLGQNCEDFKTSTGIVKARVTNKEGIEKAITQSVFDCWTMMGEGKVSLFSQWIAETYGYGTIYPSCVICSRIAFDTKSLTDAKINLNDVNVDNYMMTREIPDKGISYYDYMAKEGGKIAPISSGDLLDTNIQAQTSQLVAELEVVNKENPDEGTKQLINTLKSENPVVPSSTSSQSNQDEVAVLFMQISAPGQVSSLVNIGLTLLGVTSAAGAIAPGATWTLAKGVGKLCGAVPWLCAAVGVIAIGGQQLWTAHLRSTAASYCGDISMGTTARNGCSVIRVVRYNEEDIQKYCKVIESIP